MNSTAQKAERIKQTGLSWEYGAEFAENYLGLRMWSGMRAMFASVRDHKRTSVRAAHGMSKTTTAAAIALAFYTLRKPAIVMTTAPTFPQVRDLLWKEVGRLWNWNHEHAPFAMPGERIQLAVNFTNDWYMRGFSTDRQERMEGQHAPNILWIMDEAKGLPQWVYDAVEGSLTGGYSRALEVSTTDGCEAQTPLMKHHREERRDWNCIDLGAFDSPFVDPTDTNLKEFVVKHQPDFEPKHNPLLAEYGKATTGTEWPLELQSKIQVNGAEWIADRAEGWAARRDTFRTKVGGLFPRQGESAIIPLEWVESAINATVTTVHNSPHVYGMDVAEMGSDSTVLFERRGGRTEKILPWSKVNDAESAARVMLEVRDPKARVQVDAIGVGGKVYGRLAMFPTKFMAVGIDSSAEASDSETYFNAKAEIWFQLAERFERQYKKGNTISIPNDLELIEDLTAMQFVLRPDGRLKVEDKKEFKKRMGRSPDKGDACVYCFAEFDIPDTSEDQYIEAADDQEVYV